MDLDDETPFFLNPTVPSLEVLAATIGDAPDVSGKEVAKRRIGDPSLSELIEKFKDFPPLEVSGKVSPIHSQPLPQVMTSYESALEELIIYTEEEIGTRVRTYGENYRKPVLASLRESLAQHKATLEFLQTSKSPTRYVQMPVETALDVAIAMGKDLNRQVDTMSQLLQPEVKNPWKEAIIEELIVCFALQKEHEEDAWKALGDAITANVQMALDPAISSDARALIQKGRNETTQIVKEKLKKLVFEAVGAASVCWVGGTGPLVFDSTLASKVAEMLVQDIQALLDDPEGS